jgi:hypothetical protein
MARTLADAEMLGGHHSLGGDALKFVHMANLLLEFHTFTVAYDESSATDGECGVYRLYVQAPGDSAVRELTGALFAKTMADEENFLRRRGLGGEESEMLALLRKYYDLATATSIAGGRPEWIWVSLGGSAVPIPSTDHTISLESSTDPEEIFRYWYGVMERQFAKEKQVGRPTVKIPVTGSGHAYSLSPHQSPILWEALRDNLTVEECLTKLHTLGETVLFIDPNWTASAFGMQYDFGGTLRFVSERGGEQTFIDLDSKNSYLWKDLMAHEGILSTVPAV